MAYTLLDAAYEMYYPEAEFAFGRKTRRNKRIRGAILGRTTAGKAARIGGLLAAAGAARYGGKAIGAAGRGFKSGGFKGAAQGASRSISRQVGRDVTRVRGVATRAGQVAGGYAQSMGGRLSQGKTDAAYVLGGIRGAAKSR